MSLMKLLTLLLSNSGWSFWQTHVMYGCRRRRSVEPFGLAVIWFIILQELFVADVPIFCSPEQLVFPPSLAVGTFDVHLGVIFKQIVSLLIPCYFLIFGSKCCAEPLVVLSVE